MVLSPPFLPGCMFTTISRIARDPIELAYCLHPYTSPNTSNLYSIQKWAQFSTTFFRSKIAPFLTWSGLFTASPTSMLFLGKIPFLARPNPGCMLFAAIFRFLNPSSVLYSKTRPIQRHCFPPQSHHLSDMALSPLFRPACLLMTRSRFWQEPLGLAYFLQQ